MAHRNCAGCKTEIQSSQVPNSDKAKEDAGQGRSSQMGETMAKDKWSKESSQRVEAGPVKETLSLPLFQGRIPSECLPSRI